MNARNTSVARLLAFVLLFWCGSLRAQHEQDALLRRLDSLERVVNGLQRPAPRPSFEQGAKDVLKRHDFSGYMQLLYQWNDQESSFSIKRVRLDLQGPILAELIDYRLQVELASPKIVDAYVRIKPWRQFNVQVGQFKVPFSIENVDYGPLREEPIEYPLVLRKLMGFDDVCGLKSTGRDMGVMGYGSFFRRAGYSLVNYRIGVFNGSGINCKDDNKSKDVAARLVITPVKGLDLAGSWYLGEYGPEHTRRIRYGGGAAYSDRLFVRAEYIWGKTGTLHSEGCYATAGYFITPKWAPLARFDYFKGDMSKVSTVEKDYLLGLDYRPIKYLRLQFNYIYRTYGAGGDRDGSMVQLLLTGRF